MKTLKLIILVLLLCGTGNIFAQQAENTGTPFNGLIVDINGKGLKAKISNGKSRLFTNSTKDGKFGLTNVGENDTLVITHRGTTINIPVDGRKSIKIVWAEAADKVSSSYAPELADYGYGYVKRREMVLGASSGISGEAIRQKGFSTLQDAILTLIPGITMINGEFIVRGMNSVNSSSAALIVCDGTPVESVNSINVHDVESVEVQKGSNMYGVRGANGVIIIRTRQR